MPNETTPKRGTKKRGTKKRKILKGGSGTAPHQKTEAERLAGKKKADELYQRIGDAWVAILGLPKDFSFNPMQITVCMATAQTMMDGFLTDPAV